MAVASSTVLDVKIKTLSQGNNRTRRQFNDQAKSGEGVGSICKARVEQLELGSLLEPVLHF